MLCLIVLQLKLKGTLSSQDCDSIAQQLNLTDTLAKQFNQTLLRL
jgi:hypothetical protein